MIKVFKGNGVIATETNTIAVVDQTREDGSKKAVCAVRFDNDQGFFAPVSVYGVHFADIETEDDARVFVALVNRSIARTARELCDHAFWTNDTVADASCSGIELFEGSSRSDVESWMPKRMIDFISEW